MFKYSIINMINKKVLNHIIFRDEKNVLYLGGNDVFFNIVFDQKFEVGSMMDRGGLWQNGGRVFCR